MLENDCRVRAGPFGSAHLDEEGALVRGIEEVLVDFKFRLPGSAGVVDDVDRWECQHELATKCPPSTLWVHIRMDHTSSFDELGVGGLVRWAIMRQQKTEGVWRGFRWNGQRAR